ncbi:MAG: protein kinase [Ruminococcus sp.]|jgi:serine/threonine protein kinase|nr:protein kinase [Ruminococcus sp.]
MLDIELGQVLDGRYRLDGKLGSGNFGTVFRAKELLDNTPVRDVALKVFAPEVSSEGGGEGMFSDCSLPERILSSDLDDDVKRHFIRIFSWGLIDTPIGRCAYISMELVRHAVTLEDLMERAKKSGVYPEPEDVIDKMKQFFTGLKAAHDAGVLHRDIKGANIMLSGNVLKIADFGMGAFTDYDKALKTTLSIYAPENFTDGSPYTTRTDMYQAGLMFYEYYTGLAPFNKHIKHEEGESEADYHRRMMYELRKLRLEFKYISGKEIAATNPGVKPSSLIDAVLSRCLNYSANERFADAAEILKALDKDSIAVIKGAIAAGEYDFAEKTAEELLEKPGIEPIEQANITVLKAEIYRLRGDLKTAKDLYLTAIRIAEERNVYFLDKPRLRSLYMSVSDVCLELGQKGLAGIYSKKAVNLK